MSLSDLIVVTKNKGKLREIKDFLSDLPLNIVGIDSIFPDFHYEETGITFEENALMKAQEAYMLTGKLCMADDSGLEVEALSNLPGVKSARFAGDNATDKDNNRKLLELLKGFSWEERKARFVCVICIIEPNGDFHFARAHCEGYILEEERGESGFGYDPLFYVPEYKKTFAEMDVSLKNKISHRGKALLKAKKILREILNKNK